MKCWVLRASLAVRQVGVGEHRVDRHRDQLDVAVLLGGDVGDQVVERPRAGAVAEVERLERVVHQRRHLAEAPAQQLLHGRGAVGIGVGRRRQLGADAVEAQDHGRTSGDEGRRLSATRAFVLKPLLEPRVHARFVRVAAAHESSHLAWSPRRSRRHRPRSDHRAADRRDRARHVERHLRLGPAPLRGARRLHRSRRHPRARADGHRRGGRLGGQPHRPGRPCRDPLQHLLRPLLHVRPRAAVAVRDHAGTRVRHRRRAARLHQALRPGARRPGRAAARAAGPLRADQGARGTAGRSLRLPLRRAADRLAGGRVRRRSRRRQPARARARADRRDVHAHRATARRRAGAGGRPRAGAARSAPAPTASTRSTSRRSTTWPSSCASAPRAAVRTR